VTGPEPEVDQARALRLLSDRFDDVTKVEFVGAGQWSRCFGFEHGGRDLVVRFGPHRTDFEKDRTASLWRSADLPVPEVVEIGAAFGGHYAISTRVRGIPLESLDAKGWRAVTPSLLRALDALRRIPVFGDRPFGADDLGPFRTWRDVLLSAGREDPDHRTKGWRARLGQSPRGMTSFDRGLERLDAITHGLTVGPTMLHNDLVNQNVFVADSTVTGVFDWGCAFAGDFLYDIAAIVFWTPWYPALEEFDLLAAALAHYDAAGADLTDVDRRLEACALHVGLVHIGYNAYLGDWDTLDRTAERTDTYLGASG